MPSLLTLNITGTTQDSLTLDWSWSSTTDLDDDYYVGVYRSEAPGIAGSLDGYTTLSATETPTDNTYEDTTISGLYHPGRTWFYKLTLIDKSDSSLTHLISTPLYKYYEQTDYAYNRILYLKNLVIQKKSGRTYSLLKRRSWGTRCTVCWDDILYRSNDPACPTCHGTSWIDGYFDPVSFKAMMTPSPKYNQITMFGEWMPSDSLLVMLNYPILTARDVLVDDGNVRWMVKNVRKLEKLGHIIEQQVQITRITEDDPVYDIGVT